MSEHLKSNERMPRRFGDIVTRSSKNGNNTSSGKKELKYSKICMEEQITQRLYRLLAEIESVCTFKGGLCFERTFISIP